jgi:hypothetical protein
MKREVGEEISRKCTICGIETAHKVIESNYTDTNAYECLMCGVKDEEIA